MPEFEFVEDGDFGVLPGSGAVGGAVVEDDVAEAVVGFGQGDVVDDDSGGVDALAPDDFAVSCGVDAGAGDNG